MMWLECLLTKTVDAVWFFVGATKFSQIHVFAHIGRNLGILQLKLREIVPGPFREKASPGVGVTISRTPGRPWRG